MVEITLRRGNRGFLYYDIKINGLNEWKDLVKAKQMLGDLIDEAIKVAEKKKEEIKDKKKIERVAKKLKSSQKKKVKVER